MCNKNTSTNINAKDLQVNIKLKMSFYSCYELHAFNKLVTSFCCVVDNELQYLLNEKNRIIIVMSCNYSMYFKSIG